jgi:hypothetical protein
VAIQSPQAPAQLETKDLRHGDEKKFSVALLQPKIRDIDQEELKKSIKYAMVLIGLRAQNYPDDLEKQVLLNFIQEHYGGHTPAEIKLAFEMAIMRKLDVDPVCYENFSIAYFAGIMEAYRSWAREQVKQLPAPELKPKVLTAEEKRQLDFDYACYLKKQIDLLPSPMKRVWSFNYKCRLALAYFLLSQINKLPCRV